MTAELTVIYADVLFLINFFIDGVCFFITGVAAKRELKVGKMLFACFLGGLYSLAALYAEAFPWCVELCLHLTAAFVLCFAAFGFVNFKLLGKTVLVYFMVSSLLGGLLYAVYGVAGKFAIYHGFFYAEIELLTLVPAMAVCAVAVGIFYYNLRRSSRSETALLSFWFRGLEFKVDCFSDSGNLLVCPYSGRHVVLVKSNAVSCLGEALLEKLEAKELTQGFRLIPVSTPGGKSLLVSFLPDRAEIKPFGERNGRAVSIAVAVDFSDGTYGGMSGLVPSVLI